MYNFFRFNRMSNNNFFQVTDSMLNDILKEYTTFQRNITAVRQKQLSEEVYQDFKIKENSNQVENYCSSISTLEIVKTETESKMILPFMLESFVETFSFSLVGNIFEKIKQTEIYESFKETLGFDFLTGKNYRPEQRPPELHLNLIGVALFKGKEYISKFIRKFTKSKYSHVALLLCDVNKQKDDQDGWYIYSANGSASQILTSHMLPHVQLEKWSEVMKGAILQNTIHNFLVDVRIIKFVSEIISVIYKIRVLYCTYCISKQISDYHGAAGIRMCLFHDGVQPDSTLVTEMVDRYIGLPYETQILVMLRAMNRANFETMKSSQSAFCSEICYRFLVNVGAIEDTEIPENVWPKDFSEENDKLQLKNGVWGELIVYKGLFQKRTDEEKIPNPTVECSTGRNVIVIPIGL